MHVTKWSQYYWPVGYINQVVVPSIHRNLNVAVHIVLTSPELSALFNKTHNPKRKDFLHTPTLLHTHTHTQTVLCGKLQPSTTDSKSDSGKLECKEN